MYNWGKYLEVNKLRSARPITVAILDDGFDLTRLSIKENFKGMPGVSFQPSGLLSNTQTPYMSGVAVGYNSHGTIMAYCVMKMCPQAQILPVRLPMGGRRINTTRSFSPDPFDVVKVRLSRKMQRLSRFRLEENLYDQY